MDEYLRLSDDLCDYRAAIDYYALTTDHIFKVIDSIEAAPYEIKHLDSYVRKALYNAVQDFRAPE